MRTLFLLAAVLLATIAQAQHKKLPHAKPQPPGPYTQADFGQLVRLCGTWRMAQDSATTLYEQWTQRTPFLITTKSFTVNGTDTAQQETARIFIDKGHITFTPTVAGQNGGKPVVFTLINTKKGSFVFANPHHDFPQHVIYKPESDSTLTARINGITKKGFKEMVFPYTRAPKELDNR